MLHALARNYGAWLSGFSMAVLLWSSLAQAQGTLPSPDYGRGANNSSSFAAPSAGSNLIAPNGNRAEPPSSRQPHAVRLSDQSPSVRPMSNSDPWLATPQSAPLNSTPSASPAFATPPSSREPSVANPQAANGTQSEVIQAGWQDRVPRVTTLATVASSSSTSGSLESSTAESKKSDSLALKPPRSESEGKIEKPRSPWASLISMVASLCVVIGLFLGLAWTLRRSTGQPFGSLPKEVVQILGRTAMAPRQQVYLLRFGSKLILVSHQLGQTETLSEIEDPLEVDRLSGLCEQNTSGSVTQSFRQVFQQVALGQSTTTRKTKLRSQV